MTLKKLLEELLHDEQKVYITVESMHAEGTACGLSILLADNVLNTYVREIEAYGDKLHIWTGGGDDDAS